MITGMFRFLHFATASIDDPAHYFKMQADSACFHKGVISACIVAKTKTSTCYLLYEELVLRAFISHPEEQAENKNT